MMRRTRSKGRRARSRSPDHGLIIPKRWECVIDVKKTQKKRYKTTGRLVLESSFVHVHPTDIHTLHCSSLLGSRNFVLGSLLDVSFFRIEGIMTHTYHRCCFILAELNLSVTLTTPPNCINPERSSKLRNTVMIPICPMKMSSSGVRKKPKMRYTGGSSFGIGIDCILRCQTGVL